jgi:hypothetical protein
MGKAHSVVIYHMCLCFDWDGEALHIPAIHLDHERSRMRSLYYSWQDWALCRCEPAPVMIMRLQLTHRNWESLVSFLQKPAKSLNICPASWPTTSGDSDLTAATTAQRQHSISLPYVRIQKPLGPYWDAANNLWFISCNDLISFYIQTSEHPGHMKRY